MTWEDGSVASFTTPQSAPQVITVELDVDRVLVLEEPSPVDFVAAALAAGVAARMERLPAVGHRLSLNTLG
jgi:hypothetical protein